jgi:hypothetical protein
MKEWEGAIMTVFHRMKVRVLAETQEGVGGYAREQDEDFLCVTHAGQITSERVRQIMGMAATPEAARKEVR